MTTENHKFKLKGQINFIEWTKRFQVMAKIKQWGQFNRDNKFITTTGKEEEAFEWVLNHITDEAIQPLDISKSLSDNLVLLNNAYGYGRLKPIAQQQKIIDLIDFPVRKDPTRVFLWLEKEISILVACGGTVDELFYRRVIMSGLEGSVNPNSIFEMGDFWFSLRGTINLAISFNYENVKTMVCEYWEAHRNKRMDYDSSPFDPTKKTAASLQAKGSKKCEFCSKHRKRISKGHDTENCFFGDSPGWKKIISGNLAQEGSSSQKTDESNKSDSSSYPSCFNVSSPIFYDTGCTPTSYFKDKPSNLVHFQGLVKTATNSNAEAKGKGSIQLGKLQLNNIVWVPSFQYNLLSGIQLMNLGYKQVINGDTLEISKDNEIMCTGKLNPSFGLIEMNASANFATKSKVLSLTEWHNRLSHISANFLIRNLKANNIDFINEDIKCSSCILGKMKRSFKEKNSGNSYKPLEMIEADTTIFPITSYDGFHANVKFVDRCTGFIYSGWLNNLKSTTILEHFRIYKECLENQTKYSIKTIRTDGGTEFTSAFSNFLTAHGIVKQTTQPYRKHLPARAERAHLTILSLAKSSHIASKLPIEYYSDAHRYSNFVYNRLIREGNEMSPFEKLFDKKPDINKIFPFGIVCFAHQPSQTRKNLKKLEDSAVRCRFLGFGSDDISYHRQGYKLLREQDLKVLYSSDVIFCPEIKMESLLNVDITQDYNKIWNPLVQNILQSSAPTSNPNEFQDDEDDDNEEVVVTRASGENRIEEAISLGHIETARGSGNVPDLGLISFSTNLPISTVSHPDFYTCLSAAMNFGCPGSYEEAISSEESEKWRTAMEEEMKSIKTAKTWSIRTPGKLSKSPVKCRWVYTKKFDRFGNISRYKARLVAKGFTQRYGYDYLETFSPVLKFTSLRILIAIAAHFKFSIYQDDVPTAFLKGTLKEEDTDNFRNRLRKEFSITQGGPLEWYLGISIQKLSCGRITMDQTLYLKQKLEEFNEFIPSGGISHPLPQNYQTLIEEAKKRRIICG